MRSVLVCALFLWSGSAVAQTIEPRDGWIIIKTDKPYDMLVSDVIAATRTNKMAVVTQAGPTKMAASRGIDIPGNRVIGVFNNDFAVKILALSTAAMIEAPIRFYVTEGANGSATLAYKTPSHVFAPYLDEGGDALRLLAEDLDRRFAAISDMAVN